MGSTKATKNVSSVRFFRVALRVLVVLLLSPSRITFKFNGSAQAFVSPDVSSHFKYPSGYHHRAKSKVAERVARWNSPSHRHQNKNNNDDDDDDDEEERTTMIKGFLSEKEFGRLEAVDETIRALQLQLPTILTQALTPAMVEKVYSGDNFCFSVLVDANDSSDDEIVILNSREELAALSDVLVLTTAAAQQAILVSGSSTKVQIECQLILDDSSNIIRIPWRAKTPTLGSSSTNKFEGITDCYLSEDSAKVTRFVVRKASFNGRILNGPAIGQALKGIQSTLSNIQQNPILQNIVRTTTQQGDDNNNNPATSIFNTLRDGVLGQAATALSTSQTTSSNDSVSAAAIPVIRVDSIGELSLVTNNGWIQDETTQQGELPVPCPGTEEWKNYVDSRSCLIRFANDVIPQLSDLSIIDSTLFVNDVSYKIEADDSILMTGSESLANFFQSMALTRKGTGGTWTMTSCEVLDWKNRTVAISYEVTTNSLPQWTIQGRDIYAMDTTTSEDERPVIREIRQGKMTAKGPNSNELRLDGRWLTENVATAFSNDGTLLQRDFLTELLMNQPSLLPFLQPQKKSKTSKRKFSKTAAAASFYIMTDLCEQGASLFDMSSSRQTPPGSEQMSENIELKGYLGESIVRGSSLYNRSVGSVIFGIRESIRQKRLHLEEATAPPRVELLVATGEIRLLLAYKFRIPPPGIFPTPDSVGSGGLPLKVELVSDYKIDPDTGLITQHKLIETRVNGQLTAGDQVSRWMQRFLKLDGAAKTTRNDDGALSAILDTLSWFRPG